MKMKRTIIISTVILAVVALTVLPAMAQRGNGRGQRGGGGMGHGLGMGMGMGPGMGIGVLLRHPDMAQEAGVTDEQMEKLGDLMKKHQHDMIDGRDEVQDAKAELDDLMAQENLDTKAIDKATQDFSDAQGKMLKLRTNHMIEIREILSAEQIKKIDELAKDKRALRRSNRRERVRKTVGDPWE
jgi:Spy/CpxP family protein refolding chaperone